MKKIKDKYMIIVMLVGIIILSGTIWYFWGDKFRSMTPQTLKIYIESKGAYGSLTFILIQIIQIVIAVLPGEPIQFAGGYIYGMMGGFILTYIGLTIGSALAFFIARFFGINVVSKVVPTKHLENANKKIKSRQGIVAILVLSAIPGIPKDVLVYAAGLSNIRPRSFLSIYFLARIPAILITSYLGSQMALVF